MRTWLLATMILGCLLAANGLAWAEKSGEPEYQLQEMVVTGSRSEQAREQIPANITVVDREDIENSMAGSVPELLESQEGLFVRNLLGNGKTAQVDVRGFGETGQYNTLVLVDGRRLNSIDLSGVDWSQLPLNSIERIEISRGTGSVLYGDNAAGGVINLITRKPEKGFQARSRFTVGSYSRHREALFASYGRNKTAISLHGSFEETDGYRENNEYRAKDIGGSMRYNPIEALELTLQGNYHDDEYGLPGSLTASQLEQDREQTARPQDDAQSRDRYVQAGIDYDLGRFGALAGDISLRDRDQIGSWVSFSWESKYDVQTWGFTPRYEWEGRIAGRHNKLVAGVDLYSSELDQWSSISGSQSESSAERDSQGFYFRNELDLLPELILSFGARLEEVDYDIAKQGSRIGNQYDETAYTLGMNYIYQGMSSVFARVNKSFRFPLSDELVEFGSLNEDLEPQTGLHFETGVRHYFSPDISARLTLFRAEIEDEIFFNPGAGSFGANENHPETLHQGMELGTDMRFLDHYSIKANYTYTRATFSGDPFKDNDVPAVPRHKANLSLAYNDLLPGLDLHLGYHYAGSSYAISDQANAAEKKEDYFSLDARLSYEYKKMKAFVGLQNITGEEYSEYVVANNGNLTFYPAPETRWSAGIEYSF